MKRNRRFPIVLSEMERYVLQRLADAAHTSAAAVVRRLIWREAERQGLVKTQRVSAIDLATEELSDDLD